MPGIRTPEEGKTLCLDSWMPLRVASISVTISESKEEVRDPLDMLVLGERV